MQNSNSRLPLILTLALLPACGSASFTGKSGTKAKNADQTVEQPNLGGSENPSTDPGSTTAPGTGTDTETPRGAPTNPDPSTGSDPGKGNDNPSTGTGSTTNPGTPGTGDDDPAQVCLDTKEQVVACPVTPVDPSTNPGQN